MRTSRQLLPEPWGEGDRLQMNMKLPTGLDIGTMIAMGKTRKTATAQASVSGRSLAMELANSPMSARQRAYRQRVEP